MDQRKGQSTDFGRDFLRGLTSRGPTQKATNWTGSG